jgi:hypothetical protein
MPRDWAGIFLVGIGFCCARAACDAIWRSPLVITPDASSASYLAGVFDSGPASIARPGRRPKRLDAAARGVGSYLRGYSSQKIWSKFSGKSYHRVAVCPAVPYDSDRRFRGVVDAWGEDHRGTGQIRASVIAALAQLGIQPDELPPEVSF